MVYALEERSAAPAVTREPRSGRRRRRARTPDPKKALSHREGSSCAVAGLPNWARLIYAAAGMRTGTPTTAAVEGVPPRELVNSGPKRRQGRERDPTGPPRWGPRRRGPEANNPWQGISPNSRIGSGKGGRLLGPGGACAGPARGASAPLTWGPNGNLYAARGNASPRGQGPGDRSGMPPSPSEPRLSHPDPHGSSGDDPLADCAALETVPRGTRKCSSRVSARDSRTSAELRCSALVGGVGNPSAHRVVVAKTRPGVHSIVSSRYPEGTRASVDGATS
ncbi:unnamed protein product [Ixodes hexagonus]